MYQIDVPSAAATKPDPAAAGVPGFFTDGDLVAGVSPTVVPADFLNALMLELLNVVLAAGLTPDKAAGNQVLLAIEQLIEARAGNYVVDTGVANAYVVALNPPLASYNGANGTQVKFRAAHANTGVCTLDVGPGPVPLLRDDGTPLAAGDVQVGAVVEATYDRAANAFLVTSIVMSQLGALAKIGIGLGLENDGTGNLRVKLIDGSIRRTASGVQTAMPITAINANTALTGAHQGSALLVTGAYTLTAPATSTLWNGYSVSVIAQGGAATFAINAADKVNGGAAGVGLTILQGQTVDIVTDGAGNWWPLFQTTPQGAYSPRYITTSTTLGAGTYEVDTSAGPVTITLPTGVAAGTTLEFSDPFGAWGTNALTLARNGNTIIGQASDLVCDVSGETFRIIYNGTDWRLA